MSITRREFVEMIKNVRDNPDSDEVTSFLENFKIDLGYIEVLIGLIPEEKLSSFSAEDGPLFEKGTINWPPTHYVHKNSGEALFVKEADFFRSQGGLTEQWGKAWTPVVARSIGEARRKASVIFGVPLSHIHNGED